MTRSGDGGKSRWVVRGTTARLACVVHGEPELHVHWTHDSRPLPLQLVSLSIFCLFILLGMIYNLQSC